jgi:hypothetical protein
MAKAKEQQEQPAEGFGEAFDAPIVETVGGKPVEFRILELDDLAAVARQAAAKLADKALADLPINAGADERDRVRRYYLDREPDVAGLSRLTQELAGCRLFLRRSLVEPGLRGEAGRAAAAAADALVDRVVKERGWAGAANLAARVSGLFEPVKPKQDEPGPNAEAADESTSE